MIALPKKIVLATHNPGKVAEFQTLLAPCGVEIVSAADLDLPEPDETGTSFAENAILKANAAALASGLPALADDSGLAVRGLNGDPGIYSARWAGPDKDFTRAMRMVHDRLGDNPDRGAAFVCVLALVDPDGQAHLFEGRVDGVLAWPPRGAGGFGYDPMFIPDGETRTYGEMAPSEKKASSHRARACAALVEFLAEKV